MTMITPSYLGETIEYSSLHACRSTLEDPTPHSSKSTVTWLRRMNVHSSTARHCSTQSGRTDYWMTPCLTISCILRYEATSPWRGESWKRCAHGGHWDGTRACRRRRSTPRNAWPTSVYARATGNRCASGERCFTPRQPSSDTTRASVAPNNWHIRKRSGESPRASRPKRSVSLMWEYRRH